MNFRKFKIQATAAPVIDNQEPPARFIARLDIDNEPEAVTTYIYFDNEGSGAPLTVQSTDEARRLVYRAIVAGDIRKALKILAAKLNRAGAPEKIKFTGRIDLDRKHPKRFNLAALNAAPAA